MPCERIDLGNGSTVIACSRGRRAPKCRWCSAKSTRLCDAPKPDGSPGTCDAPMCGRHATRRGRDVDYCPGCMEREHEPALPLGKP